jgi:hypothetical protein
MCSPRLVGGAEILGMPLRVPPGVLQALARRRSLRRLLLAAPPFPEALDGLLFGERPGIEP